MISHRAVATVLLGSALLSCSLLRGDSWVKLHDKALLPVEVGKIQSALWVGWGSEPEYGYGSALLLLIDQEMDCDEAMEALSGYDWLYGSGPFEGVNGIMGYFAWYHYDDVNAGFEGLYVSGGYAYSLQGDLERQFLPLLLGDGQFYLSYGSPGFAEISAYDDDEVRGTIDTTIVDAGFAAENCGEVDRYYGYDDYWEYWDYWDYDEGAEVTP